MCYSSFPSISKLHKHIQASYKEEALLSSSTQLSLFILIIAFTAVHQFFGSGLVFGGWTHATTTIILDPHYQPQDSDSKSTVVLNTGCGVTLIYKS